MFGPQGAPPAAPQPIWRFADVESNWRVSLAPDFAAIETTAYESRKDFLKRFEAVVHALGEHVTGEAGAEGVHPQDRRAANDRSA